MSDNGEPSTSFYFDFDDQSSSEDEYTPDFYQCEGCEEVIIFKFFRIKQ